MHLCTTRRFLNILLKIFVGCICRGLQKTSILGQGFQEQLRQVRWLEQLVPQRDRGERAYLQRASTTQFGVPLAVFVCGALEMEVALWESLRAHGASPGLSFHDLRMPCSVVLPRELCSPKPQTLKSSSCMGT